MQSAGNIIFENVCRAAEKWETLTGSRGFENIGLFLLDAPEQRTAWCLPTNASVFAETGGDSVMFSLMHDESGSVSDNSPVVMTVPMGGDEPNVIVGETLREFLELGCEVGYFFLEQWQYRPEELLAWLQSPEQWARDCFGAQDAGQSSDFVEYQKETAFLRDALQLRPWPEFARRLQQLQERYLPLLNVPGLPDF